MMDAVHAVREEFAPILSEGRAFGRDIGCDPKRTKSLVAFSGIGRLNHLGLNATESLVERIAIYETLAHMDINLAVAAPGPVMTGFAFHALASADQMEMFRVMFLRRPTWSCFALTEPHAGTDAAALTTRAVRTADGWRLNGRKYMVGQGVTADFVVVFARTGAGLFGTEAFFLRPEDHAGYAAKRLPLTGCPGTNLSAITLTNIDLPDSARLGAHLKPSVRTKRLVSSAFNAMRPCIGAMALGLARSVLDRAEAAELVSTDWITAARTRLDALLHWGLSIGAAHDDGLSRPNAAGMMKVQSVTQARDIITVVMLRCPPSQLVEHAWLTYAWCDIGGLEYAEGVANIHRLNAAQAGEEVAHA